MLTTLDQKILAVVAIILLGLFADRTAFAGGNSLPPPGSRVQVMPPQMGLAYARTIQKELDDRGYDVGPADGVIGPRTRRAIEAYQRDAGLPVDGLATDTLLDHLLFARPRVRARPSSRPVVTSLTI